MINLMLKDKKISSNRTITKKKNQGIRNYFLAYASGGIKKMKCNLIGRLDSKSHTSREWKSMTVRNHNVNWFCIQASLYNSPKIIIKRRNSEPSGEERKTRLKFWYQIF